MSSEEMLMEEFEFKIDAMDLSEEFKDIIIVCYQDLLDQCLELEIQVLLHSLPSEEQLQNLQKAYEADTLLTACEQTNMYCIASLMESGYEVDGFTHLLYMLERGMDCASENDDRCFSMYVPVSMFLLAANGASESSHRVVAPAQSNVVKIKPLNTRLIEQGWGIIQDALIDIIEGITPIYLELMSNTKTVALEKGNTL